MTSERWIDLTGAANVRDLGGLPTHDGRTTKYGQALRSDNLQGLTAADIDRLVHQIGVTDVIDLRTGAELQLEGPGPITREPGVTVHHFSLYKETEPAAVDTDAVLPWAGQSRDEAPPVPAGGYYVFYLHNRPDSVVSALRTIATSPGATITHCAAGKDRTGVVTALALTAVGVTRDAVVADYAQTGERIEALVARLRGSPTYADNLMDRPVDSHRPRPETMQLLLEHLDEEDGGPMAWLAKNGWTDDDTAALRARLVG